MIPNRQSGREKEVLLIRESNRAAAVGRLMLGEMRHWSEFLEADVIDLTNLPRRQLKSGKVDIKKRLSNRLTGFCQRNFIGMTPRKLSEMYEEIKAFRGLELPLEEFERRFAPIRKEVLKGNPAHLTISISLWGLQLKIPEEHLAKDIMEAAELANSARKDLDGFEDRSHWELLRTRATIGALIRRELFAARSALMACFNLMEAYLNGLAWDYLRTANTVSLSNRSRELLEDSKSTSIRKKLEKYPEIIAGSSLWESKDDDLVQFLEVVKPFRDSLVHPSPFTAPEKFGGHDKLRMLYRIDTGTANLAIFATVKIIVRIHEHIKKAEPLPPWLQELHEKFKIKDVD